MTEPRWALLKWKHIPDYKDESQTYLSRFIIFECPLFGIFLHKIYLPDSDRWCHSHPWNFASFILRGSYIERFLDGSSDQKHLRKFIRRGLFSFHLMKLDDYHMISSLYKAPVWTLIFIGRRQRKWGFLTDGGWIEADEYFRRKRGSRQNASPLSQLDLEDSRPWQSVGG